MQLRATRGRGTHVKASGARARGDDSGGDSSRGLPPAHAGVVLILQQLRLLGTTAAPGLYVRKDGRVDLVQPRAQLSSTGARASRGGLS